MSEPAQPIPQGAPEPTPGAAEGPAAAEVGGVEPRRMLEALTERPLSEHAEVFEELHTHLQRTLAEIDGG